MSVYRNDRQRQVNSELIYFHPGPLFLYYLTVPAFENEFFDKYLVFSSGLANSRFNCLANYFSYCVLR